MFSVLLLVAVTFAFTSGEPTWTTFRVRYDVNPFPSNNFARMPDTTNEAEKNGWIRLRGGCDEGGSLGYRYMKGGDVAIVLLYDVNGFIAGMEQGIPKEEIDKNNTSYDFESSSVYRTDIINDLDVYFATAYFVDPAIICTRGRTEKQYDDQGTGTGVYLQIKSVSPNNTILAPLYERQIPGTPWVEGQCYRSIGKHYFYNVKEGMDCDRFLPFFLVYNRGKLTGFGFVHAGVYEFSKRFEHPSRESLESFLPNPAPRCLYQPYDRSSGYSTLHVFFTVRPWNLLC